MLLQVHLDYRLIRATNDVLEQGSRLTRLMTVLFNI